MMFRKKPVVIEAEQYIANSDHLPFVDQDVLQYDEDAHCQYIQTLESNRHVVSDGDWIIKGVKGEFYACKPDIFAMTYEPASAPPEGREQVLVKALETIRDLGYYGNSSFHPRVQKISADALEAFNGTGPQHGSTNK